ncbi:MAG: hypothetical protein KJ799_02915 [Bacteroidetes bacterium]|nr:hypothetical protein [Bacteroidota bacterium]
MKVIVFISSILLLTFFYSCSDSGTNPVDTNTGGIMVPSDFPTIQEAIDAANTNDSIFVSPGRYIENINFKGKNIKVRSTEGIPNTVIDGDGKGSTVTFNSGESEIAILDGFTIINGSKSGILCDSISSPTLRNLRITSSHSSYGGGIGCLNNSSPFIYDVTLIGNNAEYGGGIYCWNNSSPHLQNVRITGNFATGGGGLSCSDSSNPILENVLIVQNSAAYGGGVEILFSSSPVFKNVTIANNTSVLSLGGIYCNVSLEPNLINTIVWNNPLAAVYFETINSPNSITISYSNIEGGRSGIEDNNHGTVNWLNGNMNSDPLFQNPNAGDYHLQVGSPCIDKGDSTSIYNDYDGTRNDLGAYGGPYGNW